MGLLSAGAAVSAGAGVAAGLTEVAKTGIIDAYTTCKKAIRARFGDDEDAKEKLAQLEVRPDNPALQQALTASLQTHQAGDDPTVAHAAQTLRIHLDRVEGGLGATLTGDITHNTITADRGGIAAASIAGGARAGYTPPPAGADPR